MSQPDDWIILEIPIEVHNQAKVERHDLDTKLGKNSQVPDRKHRESGEVAELMVARWLVNQGARHHRITTDPLRNPDFIIGHYAVDVKVKVRQRCRPDFTFGIHDFHLAKPTPWYLYCGWEFDEQRLVIYGAAHRDLIAQVARLVRPGDVAHSAGGQDYRLKTTKPAREFPVSRMTAPRVFIERVGAFRIPAEYATVSAIQAPGATIEAARS